VRTATRMVIGTSSVPWLAASRQQQTVLELEKRTYEFAGQYTISLRYSHGEPLVAVGKAGLPDTACRNWGPGTWDWRVSVKLPSRYFPRATGMVVRVGTWHGDENGVHMSDAAQAGFVCTTLLLSFLSGTENFCSVGPLTRAVD
jgi:hypothetical protein